MYEQSGRFLFWELPSFRFRKSFWRIDCGHITGASHLVFDVVPLWENGRRNAALPIFWPAMGYADSRDSQNSAHFLQLIWK